MRHFILVLMIVGVVLGSTEHRELQAEELNVTTYIDMTLARLQLVLDTWRREGRSPNTGEQEAVLWEWYGTTAKAYYAFASTHRQEIARHLAAHPEVQEDIQNLRVQIHALIGQVETR